MLSSLSQELYRMLLYFIILSHNSNNSKSIKIVMTINGWPLQLKRLKFFAKLNLPFHCKMLSISCPPHPHKVLCTSLINFCLKKNINKEIRLHHLFENWIANFSHFQRLKIIFKMLFMLNFIPELIAYFLNNLN